MGVNSYWWSENQDYQNFYTLKIWHFQGIKFSVFLKLSFIKMFFRDTFSRARYILHSNISHYYPILRLIEEVKSEMRDVTFFLLCWYRLLIFICQKIAAGKLKVKTRCNQKTFLKFLRIIYLFHYTS